MMGSRTENNREYESVGCADGWTMPERSGRSLQPAFLRRSSKWNDHSGERSKEPYEGECRCTHKRVCTKRDQARQHDK